MSTSGKKPKGWDDGTAWIAEDVGSPDGDPFDEDGMFALARFDAHVESESLSSGFRDGPSGVSAEAAVAWARRHAARVIIRWFGPDGTMEASAGERPVGSLPRWDDDLQLVPRRIPGWEHLDRTDADPPISWEVMVRGDAFFPPPGFADAFEAALRAEEDIELVAFAFKDTSPVLPEDGSETAYVALGEGLRVHVRLHASTHVQACERGQALVRGAAVIALARERPEPHDVHAAADAFPTGSEAADDNARIDRTGRIF
ncbi:MAG: hypothetical protein JHC84_10570 [Solirubrobacteraceae bacterium]|nr:hypothetical protein [Solirubrobacteraceae bacterium]